MNQESEKAIVLFGPAVEVLGDGDLHWLREWIAERSGGLAVHAQLSQLKSSAPADAIGDTEVGEENDEDSFNTNVNTYSGPAERLDESNGPTNIQAYLKGLIELNTPLTSLLAEAWHSLNSPENFIHTLHTFGDILVVIDNAGYRVRLVGVKPSRHESAPHYELRSTQLILLGRQYDVVMWNEQHFGFAPPPDMPERQWDEDAFDTMTLPELVKWADDLSYKLEIHRRND